MISTAVLPVLPLLASILSLSQCFLLNAFAVENRTDSVDLTQGQPEIPEQSHNSIEENTETNIIETKMKEVERPPHLPFFVVLQQSGKKDKRRVLSSNISKRQGGGLEGLSNVVANTRSTWTLTFKVQTLSVIKLMFHFKICDKPIQHGFPVRCWNPPVPG